MMTIARVLGVFAVLALLSIEDVQCTQTKGQTNDDHYLAR
jgi:hypothetical protein